MQAEQLHGIWELVSYYGEFTDGAGERVYIYGENAIGRLTYHPEGYMSAFISQPDRAPFNTDHTQASDAAIRAAFSTFQAYSGTYTLDLARNIVTHHVTIARIPDWVGGDQVRYISIDDGILHIRSAPMGYGGRSLVAHIAWRKV